MKQFGAFLANLRSTAGLSLEELASLVDSSKSTLSRLENDEVPQPFKGPIRKLVIALAEILCTSQKETERYLALAHIDRSLLTDVEEIQAGFAPYITRQTLDEDINLEHLKRLYEQRHLCLETQTIKLGMSSPPPNMKLKIQEYANILKEIQQRLDRLHNKQETLEPNAPPTPQIHYASKVEDRLVVGYEYHQNPQAPSQQNLYWLASPNAQWLMQHTGMERFAIDDCILLTKSRMFSGWTQDDIKTIVLTLPLPIPEDLEELRQKKIPLLEKDYFNGLHYRLLSFTPSFSDHDRLSVTLAPLRFYDYYSLNPFLDEPLLTALDSSKVTARQKYGNTALTYSSTDKGISLIPTPISIQCIVVTKEQQIVLMQRSPWVAFYPNHWSASFEETMSAASPETNPDPSRLADADFFAGAIRGANAELAVPIEAIESIKILSLNVEYLTLSVDVIAVIKVDLSSEEIRHNWLLKAWHGDEASQFAMLSTDLPTVVDKLFSRTLWHPTSRMRLIQFLFHTYGIDETARAIQARKD